VEIIASMPCYSAKNVNEQRGNGVFDGAPRWLEIWVRTNWTVPPPEPPLPFGRLLPRQALTPAPSAKPSTTAPARIPTPGARL
jgi:hypothetical protein